MDKILNMDVSGIKLIENLRKKKKGGEMVLKVENL